jgi:hypothetical protein
MQLAMLQSSSALICAEHDEPASFAQFERHVDVQPQSWKHATPDGHPDFRASSWAVHIVAAHSRQAVDSAPVAAGCGHEMPPSGIAAALDFDEQAASVARDAIARI